MVFSTKLIKNTITALFAVFPLLCTANVSDETQSGHPETEAHAAENAHSETHEPADKKSQIKAFINHHLQDSHDFIFFSDEETGKHYGFSLPVILIDNGVKFFSASEFEHGEKIVEAGGEHYALYHDKIYKTDAQGTLTFDEHHHPTNAMPLDMSITKNVMAMLITALIMFLLFTGLAKSYKKGPIPTGMGRILEPLVLFIRDEVAIPNIGKDKYRKFMGYLLTVFFFILILNLFGLTPLGINVTGNIAITACLALITYFITQFSANKDYWKHIFWMPDVPVLMKIALIPIEILGTLTKPFALMIRLYANISAGHIVVMSLIGLIFVFKNWIAGPSFFGLTLFISIIEILVAFLQAFVFTMLSSLFIGMAVQEHHHEEDHDAHTEEEPIII
ncbi:F0F1 ATP synthase subunit A [Flavobacterium salilacus subsp. salilacus]|uniref:F0F1 ATP synthase subunit A n=1 Tax=Flavobacterium TaxID=237 RepID=UPI001074C537|nr:MULTISPECIES: F0F1 ATP synthase subunit A [Flavobacterium]KAF2518963.1 F0F1 ATP synthase subunit A [Flavobacterium salilacus subsp. salilacus]MBE1614875.1 F0F1 ATP synthase subunit A [Flavobacterium sp. SaA2.13]NDI98568.1 F0F1 ATP synthase subunit A [Flavobacterium salilacus subsp. altitudinum]